MGGGGGKGVRKGESGMVMGKKVELESGWGCGCIRWRGGYGGCVGKEIGVKMCDGGVLGRWELGKKLGYGGEDGE